MSVDTNFGLLQTRIDKLRMKRSHVSALSGLSAGYLSQASSGQTDLAYPDFRAIERLLYTCEALQARAGSIPIDWRNVAVVKELIRDYQNELKEPPTPPGPDDWSLLAAATSGEDPVAIAARLNIPLMELSTRMNEASRRFDFAIRQMSQSTQDARDLAVANRVEFEERKANQFGRSK